MIAIGLDTATAATAVAVRSPDGAIAERRDDPAPGAHPGHATRLLPMLDELLRERAIRWEQIDRVAVGLGPGTFTGLRVGVATARGLAQSLGAELVGVSSLAALAAPALTEHAAVLATIDARRGEVFVAAYRRDGGGAPAEVAPARALAPQAVREQLEGLLGGEAPGSWRAVGDGAVRYREALAGAGLTVPDDAGPLHRVRAGEVCELGVRQEGHVPLHEIAPDYRRLPDAELAFGDAGADRGRRG